MGCGVASDGMFSGHFLSMEGSIINLPEVIALKKKYKVSGVTLCGCRVLPFPLLFPTVEVKWELGLGTALVAACVLC